MAGDTAQELIHNGLKSELHGLFKNPLEFKQGRLKVPEGPDWGLELDEQKGELAREWKTRRRPPSSTWRVYFRASLRRIAQHRAVFRMDDAGTQQRPHEAVRYRMARGRYARQ